MPYNIFKIGVNPALDFEETIKVKLLNIVSFLFLIIATFFVIFHAFFTKKYEVASAHFVVLLFIPFIYLLQYKHKYKVAKFVFFLLLHTIIFVASMFLLSGQGVEYFHIVVSIILIIIINNPRLAYALVLLNIFLFISPQLFLHPYSSIHYSFVTSLVLFFSIISSIRFFILIQDQFKKQLKVQNEHLEILNEEKNDLMSIVAHDLKTPFNQIKGLVSVLELGNTQFDMEQKQLIKKIKGVADREHKKITEFLDAKTFEDTFNEGVLEKIRVQEVVETVLDEMIAQAIAKGIKLLYLNKSKKNKLIDGRKEWLFKVISNLVSNAIKFSNADTEIRIEVTSDQKQIIVLIKDQGQGFSKDDMRLIFKKNSMLSATPTANESSSGMGLYIVKKYVDQMKGSLEVDSEIGKGAAFYVKLPIS